MGEKFDIAVTPDRTKARLTLYSSEISFEEIKCEVEKRGIVEGLRWDELQSALQQWPNVAGDSMAVDVAKVNKPGCLVRYGNMEMEVSREGFRELKDDLRALYRFLTTSQPANELPPCLFVSGGSVFFRELFRREFKDVYGASAWVTVSKKPLLQNTSTVVVKEKEGWLEYSAVCDGYVTLTPKDELHIIEPIVVSADKMEMYFTLASTASDKKALLDCLYESAKTNDDRFAATLPEREEADTLFEPGRLSKILVRKGIRPRQGKDALLSILLTVEKRPSEEDLYMDLKAFSRIFEIGEGTVIAEKTRLVQGVGGFDVFKKPVKANPVRDILFRVGKNVREQKGEETTRYVASIGGILNLSEKGAEISEVLHVKKDVGPETGHIGFSKSIVINGSVLSGYKVRCGGDLLIKGSVENGAAVFCEGDASVLGGIYGKATVAEVKGNARIGFLQEAGVRVGDNLTVQSAIFNSRVFCGGDLVVQGRGVEGEERGCVIGGNITAMKTMDLYSLGSSAMRTDLVCGANLELVKVIRTMKSSIASLNKRITRLTREIGIDMTRPDAAEKLKSLPAPTREAVRKGLLEMRSALRDQTQLQEKLAEAQEKAWNREPKSCVIIVRRKLFPDLSVQICQALTEIRTELANVRFKLTEDGINVLIS